MAPPAGKFSRKAGKFLRSIRLRRVGAFCQAPLSDNQQQNNFSIDNRP
jgi:hypothetical protein